MSEPTASLIAGQAKQTARLIMAQLAHVCHLEPRREKR